MRLKTSIVIDIVHRSGTLLQLARCNAGCLATWHYMLQCFKQNMCDFVIEMLHRITADFCFGQPEGLQIATTTTDMMWGASLLTVSINGKARILVSWHAADDSTAPAGARFIAPNMYIRL